MKMNEAQKEILKVSEEIEMSTHEAIRLTYAQGQTGMFWFLYENGVKTRSMHTNEASAFIKGWQCSKMIVK